MTRFLIIFTLIIVGFMSSFSQYGWGNEDEETSFAVPESFRVTGYPLPRFVSIRAKEAYVRTGPGTKYPVKWVINKVGLPVEITLEFENWRKIKVYDGVEGGIHQSLLSGRRHALISADEAVPLFRKPDRESIQKAFVEPLAMGVLEECIKVWCLIESEGYEGWVERKYIWGIYENEIFD